MQKFARLALLLRHNSFVGKLKGEASVRFAFFASVQKGGLLLCKEARSGNTSSKIAAFGKEGLPLATTYPRWEPLSPQVSVLVSSTHRFNTDTVLLAWFSAPRKGEICADFGTGCGTIPLLWCAKAQTAEGAMPGKVYAVELQADACALALRSVERNQLENTICIINNDINNLQYLHPPRGLDLVACNPPYKPEGTGIKNPQEGLSIARHEGACTFAEIAAAAARQLRWGGRFCCCLRPERLAGAMEARRRAGLEPKRLRFVQQRPDKAPFLFLLQAARGGNPGLRVEPVLFVEDGKGGFSQEMLQIYGSYKEGHV